MLVQGPTLPDAACIWITKYDGYTPAKRFIKTLKENFHISLTHVMLNLFVKNCYLLIKIIIENWRNDSQVGGALSVE